MSVFKCKFPRELAKTPTISCNKAAGGYIGNKIQCFKTFINQKSPAFSTMNPY